MPLRRRPATFKVTRDELDGVPIYWAEGPPPFFIGIVFRVGRADETLASGGTSHIVEHLAIPPRQPVDVDVNGTVTGTETMFWAAGRREDALAAFASILEGLAELPLERLEAERRILLTEAASAGDDPVQNAASLRFGPRGHGLLAYQELGFYRLEARDVEHWWRTYFGAGNAALWMTGRPPRRFRLPLLPGERHAPPSPDPIADVRWPAHNIQGPSGGVSAAFLTERSFAANVVLSIAEARVRQRLRFELGFSYGVHSVYDRLTPRDAHGVLWADCLDSRAETVREELLSALRTLGEEGPTSEELEEATRSLRHAVSEPVNAGMFAHGLAVDELMGDRLLSLEELVEGRAAVRPAEAARVLADAQQSLLLTTPDGAGDLVAGFERYPFTSSRRVGGRTRRRRGLRRREKETLVVGDEGVTLVSPVGEAVTVLFRKCIALLRWVDGRRVLWGEDGFSLQVAPELWKGGDDVVRTIDAAVPADVVIPMERELEAHSAAVDSAAGEGLRGRLLTRDELAALPRLLREGERVLVVAEASQRFTAGVAAVTDRRFLFLYFDDVKLEIPLPDIVEVRTAAKRFWHDNELVLVTETGEERFYGIRPDERLEELADALRA